MGRILRWDGLARSLIQGQVQSQVLLTLSWNRLLEKPSSLHSQENSSVTEKAQVNLEPTSFRESETNLPFKGNQKTNKPASNESVNNEQPVRKKKVLRSLRDFLYEPIP